MLEINLLYIEDKTEFRLTIMSDLEKIFNDMYVAKNEEEGLSKFKKYYPNIVIIDAELSSFDWQGISRHIKDVKPETKIIILTKHAGEKYLYDAIDIGITHFIRKPLEVSDVLEAINDSISKLKYELETKIFYSFIENSSIHPNAMVMLFKKSKPILLNQIFLNFFNVENVEEFNNSYNNIGDLFIKRDGFLYNKENEDWFDEVSSNIDKVYYVELENTLKEKKHFLLRYQHVFNEKSYTALSLDDVTDVNLDEAFHEDNVIKNNEEEKKSLFNLLGLIQRKKVTVHLYNYYKGLTIIHDATIEEVKDNNIVIKTDFLQQKAIKYEGKTLISSEILPSTISCDKVLNINLEKRTVKMNKLNYVYTSPATRRTIRVSPSNKQTVSMFFQNNNVYKGQLFVEDISLDSVKILFHTAHINLKPEDKVFLDIVLPFDPRPMIINTEATVLNRIKSSVIFTYNLNITQKQNLVKYLNARQIEIIKEFKLLKVD